MSITTQTRFNRKKYCLERISSRSVQDRTTRVLLDYFYACIIFKRCMYYYVCMCVWRRGGVHTRGLHGSLTRSTPRIRQQGIVASVSASESIKKRSPDLLSSHRTKERSCDRMTSEKKKWQSIIHDVRALQIFYFPKGKIDTELISRGRCKSTTNSGFCPLQPIRHPPSRALVVRAVHPIWQLLLYCYIANPSPSRPLSFCHPPIPSPLCPFLPFTLFQNFSK